MQIYYILLTSSVIMSLFGFLIVLKIVLRIDSAIIRKFTHISIGPVFIYLIHKLFQLPLGLVDKLLLGCIPLSSSVLFILSTKVSFLGLISSLIRRGDHYQLSGVVIYGVLFAIYPYYANKHFKNALICMVFGDGFAAFGTNLQNSLVTNIELRTKLLLGDKSVFGALLFIIAASIGMIVFNESLLVSILLAFIGCFVEIFCRNYDNALIVLIVFLASCFVSLI